LGTKNPGLAQGVKIEGLKRENDGQTRNTGGYRWRVKVGGGEGNFRGV